MKKLFATCLTMLLSVPLFSAPTSWSGVPVDDTLGLSVQVKSAVVSPTPNPNYAASAKNIAASTGTICALYGSATKNIKITNITISGMANAALASNISINKRSTFPGGVVASTPTVVPLSTFYPAGTAVMKSYTLDASTPTATLVGLIDSFNVVYGTTIANPPYSRDFSKQPIVITTTTAEGITVDGDGTVFASPKINCSFTWTEEPL